MRVLGLLVALTMLTTVMLCAQRFSGNPTRQQWKQIDTDTVRVIFAEEHQKQAQQIAGIIHRMQQNNANSLGSAHRKVSVVLQHRSLFSNAYGICNGV